MPDEKITVLAIAKAKPGIEDKVKAELMALVEPTRAETACISYDLHQDTEDKASFMFYENWQSKEALDEHIQTPHLQNLLAKADDLFDGPLDVTIWKKLS